MSKLCHAILRVNPQSLDVKLPKISVGRFGSATIKYANVPEDVNSLILTIETPEGNTFSVAGENGEFYVKPGMLDSEGLGAYYVMAKDKHGEVVPLGKGQLAISVYPTAAQQANSVLPVSSVMDVNGVSRQLLAVQDETGAWTLTVGKIIETPNFGVNVDDLPEDLTAKDSMAKIKAAVNAIKKAVTPSMIAVALAFQCAFTAYAERLDDLSGEDEVYTALETETALATLEAKVVKSVNGEKPDADGNVEVKAGADKEEIEGIIEETVTKDFVEGLGISSGATGVTSIDGKTGELILEKPDVTSHKIGVTADYHEGTKIATITIARETHTAIKVKGVDDPYVPPIKAVVPPEFYDIYAPIPETPSLETLGAASATSVSSLERRVGTAEGDVSELKTWALGNDVAVKVEHATEPNATFSVLYHGETQYSSDSEAAATVARANEYTDNHLATLAGIVDEKLGEKADRAWGKYTSGGAPANGDTLIVEKKSLAITGGGNFTYIEAGTGGYYVATVSLGNTWTIESLADAQNPDNPTTLTWKDSDGNAIQTITSTSSREVYAVAGVDMMAPSCNSQGVDDVVSIPFPVVSTEPPTVLYVPDLDHYGVDDFTEANATNWPDYIKSVSWSGASGNRIAHITMKGHPGRGFFKAKFVKDGTVYTRFDKPIGFSNVVIKGIPYKVDIVTINGHKILEVIED